jgi:hypothetical protein
MHIQWCVRDPLKSIVGYFRDCYGSGMGFFSVSTAAVTGLAPGDMLVMDNLSAYKGWM